MKRIISLLLTLVFILSCVPVAAVSEPLSFNLEELFVRPVIDALKNRLLVPDSLSLRDIGCVGLSVGDNSYIFFAIQYVAKNKMGGYTDDWVFALTTQEYPVDEFAMTSADGDLSHGSDTMLAALKQVMWDYLGNSQKYRTHTKWKTLPTDSMLYN